MHWLLMFAWGVDYADSYWAQESTLDNSTNTLLEHAWSSVSLL